MQLSYDPLKSASNEALWGLPFAMAQHFEWPSALVIQDVRKDYGERRFSALGLIGGRLHVLVFTPREALNNPRKSER